MQDDAVHCGFGARRRGGLIWKGTVDDNRITIGEMAQLNSVSVRMLRFYHEKGLLVPSTVDENTGYRYYSIDQCVVLDFIQQMQSLEIPLSQIKKVLDRQDGEYALSVLEGQLDLIKEKARKTAIAQEVCSSLIHDYGICRSKPICDEIMLENLPERKIVRIPHKGGEAYAAGMTSRQAKIELEHALCAAKRRFVDLGYPLVLLRNVGCIIPREHLVKREYVFSYSYVFAYDFGDELDADDLAVFPAGQYVTMYSDGICYPDGSYKALDNISKMLDYVERRGMQVAGDYFDEIIAELPPFFGERSDMLYKLYVPVK